MSQSGTSGGQPVLLLHGGGVAGWMWTLLATRLSADHTVLIPDLPGHGASADEPYRSHQETVDALALELTRRNTEPVAVIGFSLGAQLAIELASTHPHLVERAMIISAQAHPAPLTRLTLAALGVAAPLARAAWFARMQAKALFIPPSLIEDYVATSAQITRGTLLAAVGANMRFTLPAAWARFHGRALVLAGRDERAVMRRSASAIHAALPSSELEIVDGCGHGIPLQRPDWFYARVSAWLAAPQ